MTPPPSGTVTPLCTDIEGSTRLAQQEPDAWETSLARFHAWLAYASAQTRRGGEYADSVGVEGYMSAGRSMTFDRVIAYALEPAK